MHILLFTHYFAPENVAPTRRWDALTERFVQDGHSVTVVCPPPHYPSGKLSSRDRRLYGPETSLRTRFGARVHRTRFLQHGSDIVTRTLDHVYTAYWSYRKAHDLAHAGARFDVVVATAPGIPTLYAGRRFAREHGAPLVTEMRDAWPDLVTHTAGMASGKGLVVRAKRAIHKRVTSWQRDSARVVTTTDRFANVLAERGVREPVVIRNGTSLERYSGLGSPEPHGTLRALHMGNMGRSQGLDTVIRAAADLLEEGAPVQVRFVGHGAARQELRKLNKQLGSPVEIRKEVLPSEVASHYSWADTLIVSLQPWEPFEWTVPSKLYEALATGKHITGLLAGEAAEVLRATGAGVVLPPGNVQTLVDSWRRMAREGLPASGTGGQSWVRAHANYDGLAQVYLEVFKRACAEFADMGSSRA